MKSADVGWVREQLQPIVGGQLSVVLVRQNWMDSGLSFYVATVTSFPFGESSELLLKMDDQLFFVRREGSSKPWSRLRVFAVREPGSPGYKTWAENARAYCRWSSQVMYFVGKAETEVDLSLFETLDVSDRLLPALRAVVHRTHDVFMLDVLMNAVGQSDCRRLRTVATESNRYFTFPHQDHCVLSFCHSQEGMLTNSGHVESMIKLTLCIYDHGWNGKREVLATDTELGDEYS